MDEQNKSNPVQNDNEHQQNVQRVRTELTRSNKSSNTFIHRHKYKIRQVCGVVVLVCIVVGIIALLSKLSGKTIQSGDSDASEHTTAAPQSQTTTEKSPSSSSENDSSSKTESSQTTEITTGETEQSETTTEETTGEYTAQTTQETSATTTAGTKATTKTKPVNGDAKIENRNGVTYVNGILIANKTYPLPVDYNPGLDPQAQAAFNKMQQAAALEGINLWICSGFRSYGYQSYLYNNYVAYDGKANADRYSARPGHSEHQSGLAMDINNASSSFDNTAEAKWLAQHCNDYGFIIRYKKGKESSTGYIAESWHIRYLGDVDLCKKIEASGLSLEEYLGITSVYAQP